jgi:hypothetical protein
LPLDATRAATRLDAIDAAFDAIGTDAATRFPRGRRNSEVAAAEYLIATRLLSKAEKRRERAARAAVAAGVLPDHRAHPMPLGEHPAIWSGEYVTVSVSVVQQAAKPDIDGLIADLIANGVKPALIERLRARRMIEFPPAHRFTAALVAA